MNARILALRFALSILCLFVGSLAPASDAAAKRVSPGPSVNPGIIQQTPGGGGQYRGPGDIVPPLLPFFDPEMHCGANPAPAECDSCLVSQGCGMACPELPMASADESLCVNCQDGSEPKSCYTASPSNLTFGTARNFCADLTNDTCSDANGNVTFCASGQSVCEVHVYQSAWLNAQSFTHKPLCTPVPSQICTNGQNCFQAPHAFEEFHDGAFDCEDVEVCITVQRDCLCKAIAGWEAALGLVPGQPSPDWDDKWLFHIGFTHCEGCDCAD